MFFVAGYSLLFHESNVQAMVLNGLWVTHHIAVKWMIDEWLIDEEVIWLMIHQLGLFGLLAGELMINYQLTLFMMLVIYGWL